MRITTAIPLLFVLSCGSTSKQVQTEISPDPPTAQLEAPSNPAPVADLEPLPWTDEFQDKALLLANRITVEGPPGLIEHMVFLVDDESFEQAVQSVPGGLRKSMRPKDAAAASGAMVRGQLDAWQLAAFEQIEMRVMNDAERIQIRASGDALWENPDGERMRAAELNFDMGLGLNGAQEGN